MKDFGCCKFFYLKEISFAVKGELPKYACEKLHCSAIKNNADIVRGGYRVVSGAKESEVLFGNTNSLNLAKNILHTSLLGCFTSVLYKHKFLDTYKLGFPLDMHIGEDNVFLPERLCIRLNLIILAIPANKVFNA